MTTTPATEPTPNGAPAPTQAGSTPRTLPPLTRTQKILTSIITTGTVFIAGLGFAGSYEAVTAKAHAKGFGWFADWITIGVDAGIGVFLALDLLLTWLRMPYPMLRQVAWLLTGATIVFNASASWPDALGVAMHSVIPVLFVAAVEAARHAIGRIADITADKHVDGVPLARWIVDPIGSFRIWRRMRLWNIRSYSAVLDLEREARIYRAQLRKDYGRGWRRKAPADKRLVLRLAADGMTIAEAIDLPEREARKHAEVEAKRETEARTKTEIEAEAKHQADLRKTEAEAKRRTELAEAEAAETEAKSRAEATARIVAAETEAKLAEIARAQKEAEAEAELKQQRRAAETARLQAEAARHAREQAEAEAQRRREQQARDRAQRITAQAAATSTSVSGDTPAPTPKRTATSGSTSGSVSPIGGRGAKKQVEVEAVLARLVEANDPKAYPLSEVMEDFGLTQTTAYDRLVTAQKLWAEANPAA